MYIHKASFVYFAVMVVVSIMVSTVLVIRIVEKTVTEKENNALTMCEIANGNNDDEDTVTNTTTTSTLHLHSLHLYVQYQLYFFFFF